jgi:hypothetical protein
MTRKQTGNHGDMDWYFSPGPGASCAIQAYIPDSSAITATAAHYQLFAASGHTNLASDVKLSQAGSLGNWLTIGTFTTATGAFDLLLNDDVNTGLTEVAGPATATCTAPPATTPTPTPTPAGPAARG